MTELDVEVSLGPVRPIAVSAFQASAQIVGGPCRIFGWSLRESSGGLGADINAPDAATGAIVAATAGSVQIPAGGSLTGFDISLSTAGTAAMTVTVSNVPNGPYTYTIAVGATSLSIRYPVPLPATGAQPVVAWSATAAAVGNVTAYGGPASGLGQDAAAVEMVTGSVVIAEVSMQLGGTATAWLGPMGVNCPGGVKMNSITGTWQGVVYAAYYRE